MKRVWIAVGLVAVILAGGMLALWHLEGIAGGLQATLDQLAQAVEEQEDGRILALAGIRRYIHHDELDAITGGCARLAALARYRDYGELAAETDRMRHLVAHILESERPTLGNIL